MKEKMEDAIKKMNQVKSMDEKYKQYENHDWQSDQKWIDYYGQLCPHSSAGLSEYQKEKFRRKWYKRNKDEDFQIDYKPLPEDKSKTKKKVRNITSNTSTKRKPKFDTSYWS